MDGYEGHDGRDQGYRDTGPGSRDTEQEQGYRAREQEQGPGTVHDRPTIPRCTVPVPPSLGVPVPVRTADDATLRYATLITLFGRFEVS